MCNNCYRNITQNLDKYYSNQYQGAKKTITHAYKILIGKLKFSQTFMLDPKLNPESEQKT